MPINFSSSKLMIGNSVKNEKLTECSLYFRDAFVLYFIDGKCLWRNNHLYMNWKCAVVTTPSCTHLLLCHWAKK